MFEYVSLLIQEAWAFLSKQERSAKFYVNSIDDFQSLVEIYVNSIDKLITFSSMRMLFQNLVDFYVNSIENTIK